MGAKIEYRLHVLVSFVVNEFIFRYWQSSFSFTKVTRITATKMDILRMYSLFLPSVIFTFIGV